MIARSAALLLWCTGWLSGREAREYRHTRGDQSDDDCEPVGGFGARLSGWGATNRRSVCQADRQGAGQPCPARVLQPRGRDPGIFVLWCCSWSRPTQRGAIHNLVPTQRGVTRVTGPLIILDLSKSTLRRHLGHRSLPENVVRGGRDTAMSYSPATIWCESTPKRDPRPN